MHADGKGTDGVRRLYIGKHKKDVCVGCASSPGCICLAASAGPLPKADVAAYQMVMPAAQVHGSRVLVQHGVQRRVRLLEV